MKDPICFCNSCGTSFEIYLQIAKKGDVEAQFFRCPICKKVYPVLFTDSELRSCINGSRTIMSRRSMIDRAKQLEDQYYTDLVLFKDWRLVQ